MKTKKKKLSTFNFQLSTLFLLAAILFAGCKEDNPAGDPDNPDKPTAVMQDAKVSGTILDTGGNPLSGVSVTTGTEKVTTGSDGAFAFTKAGTINDRAVFKLEKAGYFTLTRSAVKDDQGEVCLQAMMIRKGNASGISLQTDFDAGSAQTLQVGGLTLEFPAGSVVKADGSAYNGSVHADVLYLAPGNENAPLLMPGGDLTAGTAKNSSDMLLPYGIADVELTDASGNPLNVKKESGVEISFPVPSGAMESSIPHWTFNEGYGVWVEEGTLTKQGNVYKGVVNHFSPRGGGKKRQGVTFTVHVVACDESKGGVPVAVNPYYPDDDLAPLAPSFNGSGVTNSAGDFTTKVPSFFGSLQITATYKNKTQLQTIPWSSDFGKQIIYLGFDDDCGRWPAELTPDVEAWSGGQAMGSWRYEEYHGGVVTRMDHLIFNYDPLNGNKASVAATNAPKNVFRLVSIDGKLIKVQRNGVEYTLCTSFGVSGSQLLIEGGNVPDFEDYYGIPLKLEK